MNERLTVKGASDALLTEVISSLPVSFAHAIEGADVAYVDGSAGWPARVAEAAESGARGIIVGNPTADAPDLIEELARSIVVPVVLSEGWAGNPTVDGVASLWASSISSATVVESSTTLVRSSGLDEALFRQLRVLRALGFDGVHLSEGAVTSSAYSWVGHARSGAQVVLFGVRSSLGAEGLQVDVAGPVDSVRLTLAPPLSARPGLARRVTVEGGELLPTIYETAHRAAFRHLHEQVVAARPRDELLLFAADVRHLRELLA